MSAATLALRAAIILTPFLGACDGSVEVDGRVYARASGDSSCRSVAMVGSTFSDTAGLRPLRGATVWVFHHASDTSSENPESVRMAEKEVTSIGGSFHYHRLGSPFEQVGAIRVTMPGYVPAVGTFVNKSIRPNLAVVVLAPSQR